MRDAQIACMRHFQTQPLSALAPAATTGGRKAIQQAVAALSPAVREAGQRALLRSTSVARSEPFIMLANYVTC